MASFKPLNIESDDESEVEIDDTKELQIEEALKLYQIALRYHSDGPATYPDAAKAYEELFKSDIFTYPESLSELSRIDKYGPLPEVDPWTEILQTNLVDVPFATDNAPSTLPQVLHLAHKNYGEFILLYQAAQLRGKNLPDLQLSWPGVRDAAVTALDHFVVSLDKDETDIDVWSQSSTIGSILHSRRLARFCLESIFDIEEDGLDDVFVIPGITETATTRRLYNLATQLHDTLSLMQGPLSTAKQTKLKDVLRKRLERFDRSNDLLKAQPHLPPMQSLAVPHQIVLQRPHTWTALAQTISDVLCSPRSGNAGVHISGTVQFDDTNQVRYDHDNDGSKMDIDVWPLPQVSDLDAIFPGRDNGLPCVPPPAFGDIEILKPKIIEEAPSMPLPTRKRSNDAAGLETPDTGRIKSKRIRARESLLDALPSLEQGLQSGKKTPKDPFEETLSSDRWCFQSADDILVKVDAERFGTFYAYRPGKDSSNAGESSAAAPHSFAKDVSEASRDLYSLFACRPETIPRLTPLKLDDMDKAEASPQVRFDSALQADRPNELKDPPKGRKLLDQGLDVLLHHVMDMSLTLPEIAFTLVQALLCPSLPWFTAVKSAASSSYLQDFWTEQLKSAVVKILVTYDSYIFQSISMYLETMSADHFRAMQTGDKSEDEDHGIFEMVQAIYELHLEMLSAGGLSEDFEAASRTDSYLQEERIERWSDLAQNAMDIRRQKKGSALADSDELNLRFIWANVTHFKISSTSDQQSVLAYMQELRQIFAALNEPVIHLRNNDLMSVLSGPSIDSEIAKSSTSEFFARIFDSSDGDPVAIIEGLEPLLEHVHRRRQQIADHALDSLKPLPEEVRAIKHDLPGSPELIDFLCTCSNEVLLALWQRLRASYQQIEYNPMISFCYFRSVEIMISELLSVEYAKRTPEDRQSFLFKSIQRIHETFTKVNDMTRRSNLIYDFMDRENIPSFATALVRLLKILQYANFADDEVRVGARQLPFEENTQRGKTYRNALKVTTDCQLSCWVTLYMLLYEAGREWDDLRDAEFMDKARMEFLRSVHTATGLRHFCGGSDRILLNLLKKEVPLLKHVTGYEFEFSQVLVDLYDLNCFVNPSWEQLPHDCSRDVSLDRAAAVQAVDLLLLQAEKIKPADLHKHALRESFERVNMVVARKKPTEAILRNRSIYAAFLKSPINPLDLFRCLNGEGGISIIPIPKMASSLADQGWYFTMGFIALSRFRSQKRVGPGPTDDIDTAITFFTQDLEFGSRKWETWFRLAQAFDSKLEDRVTWSAEPFNKHPQEVAQLERSAIHCYRMATALAGRIVDPEFESSAKVTELYSDFATRIYASSREPFCMRAFSNEEATKFLSTDQLVQVRPFRPLQEQSAWKLAKTLFQRAIHGNPLNWLLHFMLGKCLWKLYIAGLRSGVQYCKPNLVVTAFQKAIELLPRERRDRKEPILEPHYKLVVIIHKLMTLQLTPTSGPLNSFELSEACEMMRATFYASKVGDCEDIDDWDTYILSILKQLRTADKANWHHRIIVRSARIIYGVHDHDRDFVVVIGAKHELTQQLFTKTMVLQAWRPELERSGRHFVYTAQYTRFFIEILRKMNDRTSLEQLVKRVRKKSGDFYNFEQLWTWIYYGYIHMMRRQARSSPGQEFSTFGTMDTSEFHKRKELLEEYCHDPGVEDQTLDILREAIEFKRTNHGLEKPVLIDELIGELYALLFSTAGARLWAVRQSEERDRKQTAEAEAARLQREKAMLETRTVMNVGNLISTAGPAAADPPRSTPDPPPSSAPPAPGEHTPAKRKVGVGRREVRLAAEACVAKPGPPPQQHEAPPRREVQIVIPALRRRSSNASGGSGSVHDSADDESELSEVDEDVVNQGGVSPGAGERGRAFPGLDGEESDVDEDAEEREDDGEDEEMGDAPEGEGD